MDLNQQSIVKDDAPALANLNKTSGSFNANGLDILSPRKQMLNTANNSITDLDHGVGLKVRLGSRFASP